MYNNFIGLDAQFVNMLLLITKHYIYAIKCCKLQLSFVNLASKITEMEAIESAIVRKKH